MRMIRWFFLFFFFQQALAQTGPAGVGTTDGSSSLQLWLDASKSLYLDTFSLKAAKSTEPVYVWTDLSGSKNHVKAKSDSTRPVLETKLSFLNQQNALRFYRNASKGRKRTFLVSSSFSKTNDITLYSVFYPVSKGGGNNISPFQKKGSIPSDTLWYAGAGIVNSDVVDPSNDVCLAWNDTSLAVGGGDSLTKIDYTLKTPVGLNKATLGMLRKEVETTWLTVGKNGTTTSISAGTQPINNSKSYSIGSTYSKISSYDKEECFFDGYIATVLVYNKKLSEAESILLENHLAAKYAIALDKNDLYKADDEIHGNYDFDLAGIGLGTDGMAQTRAKGEGIIDISNPSSLDPGEYLLWATNDQKGQTHSLDVPEGTKQRFARTWKASETGEVGNVELVLDTKLFPKEDLHELVLLIDTDNNGTFENEKLGEGMIPNAGYMGDGKYRFRNVNLNHDNKFTFGWMKPACTSDCDAAFSPNGDGISDTYLVENGGKVVIYDKAGQLIRELRTPFYWDGTKANGEVVSPGLYFLVSNEASQKTVTVIR